jgi:hypothetical protein
VPRLFQGKNDVSGSSDGVSVSKAGKARPKIEQPKIGRRVNRAHREKRRGSLRELRASVVKEIFFRRSLPSYS